MRVVVGLRQHVAGQVVQVALLHGRGDGHDEGPAWHLHGPPDVDDHLGVVHLPLVEAGDRAGVLRSGGLLRRRLLGRLRAGGGRRGRRDHRRRDAREVPGGALLDGARSASASRTASCSCPASSPDADETDEAEAAGHAGGDSDPAGD